LILQENVALPKFLENRFGRVYATADAVPSAVVA
jgi:hypothetical protein